MQAVAAFEGVALLTLILDAGAIGCAGLDRAQALEALLEKGFLEQRCFLHLLGELLLVG